MTPLCIIYRSTLEINDEFANFNHIYFIVLLKMLYLFRVSVKQLSNQTLQVTYLMLLNLCSLVLPKTSYIL